MLVLLPLFAMLRLSMRLRLLTLAFLRLSMRLRRGMRLSLLASLWSRMWLSLLSLRGRARHRLMLGRLLRLLRTLLHRLLRTLLRLHLLSLSRGIVLGRHRSPIRTRLTLHALLVFIGSRVRLNRWRIVRTCVGIWTCGRIWSRAIVFGSAIICWSGPLGWPVC